MSVRVTMLSWRPPPLVDIPNRVVHKRGREMNENITITINQKLIFPWHEIVIADDRARVAAVPIRWSNFLLFFFHSFSNRMRIKQFDNFFASDSNSSGITIITSYRLKKSKTFCFGPQISVHIAFRTLHKCLLIECFSSRYKILIRMLTIIA